MIPSSVSSAARAIHSRAWRAGVFPALALLVALATACGSFAASPSAAGTASAPATSTSRAAGTAARGPTPSVRPSPGASATVLRAPLPLSGEYAVVASARDRTLSVVPIGLASVAATVELDVAPHSVATGPGSDQAFVAGDVATDPTIVVASLNAAREDGHLNVGGHVVQVAAPPAGASGPVVLIGADDTLRALNPASRALGARLQLPRGPHAVAMSLNGAGATQQVYVTDAANGTVSVLDSEASDVQTTVITGGQPIGVVPRSDGLIWVVDAASGAVKLVDPTSAVSQETIPVGPNLIAAAATSDGHYLVIASSDPAHALYAVDLFQAQSAAGAQISPPAAPGASATRQPSPGAPASTQPP